MSRAKSRGDGPELWELTVKVTEEEGSQGLVYSPLPPTFETAGIRQSCATIINKVSACLRPKVEPMDFMPGNTIAASSEVPEAGSTHT